MLQFLNTPQSSDDWLHCVEQFKHSTRRLAKRQFTWFRQEPLFRWLSVQPADLSHAVETIVQDFEQNENPFGDSR